jgi:type VI secretion system secreted protein Hcp
MKVRRVFVAAVCALTCVLAIGRAQAAQSMYLEIPGVVGEVVTPAAFANQIAVLSLSSGGSYPCGGGQLSMSSLNIMKMTDRASLKLSIALRDHTVYPTMTLRFVRSDGQVYQTYVLNNAVVESLQHSGSAGGDDRNTESVSFGFAQMVFTYQYFDGSGKAVGPAESMTFTSAQCP